MKTRKLLALVLAIAMIATVFVVPSAAVAPGAACEILGLLEGDGEGVTAEYLAKGTMRVQGLLITLRARGLEDEALAFTGTDTFSDAGDVAEFWAPILAYAYANPDLGWIGDGDGTFRPADIMTGAELAKVMLALLGYVQGEDFEWDDIATFAESKGVTVPEGEATNDDLAGSLVEALALETKEGGTLVDAMIADGVVTEEAALEAEVKETEPAVTTAFAVEVAGAKKVKAIFAEAQDIDTAVITLKKGAVGQAITPKWNDAKKEVTLTKAIAFTKGDYTLTINGEAVDFTIEADETATELVVGASTVYQKMGAQDIKLHLLNQYGEQMQWTAGQVVFGASLGEMAEKDSKTATLKLPDDGAKVTVKAGATSTIFAYYSPKNFTVNATITVVEDQKLSSIVFTGPIALGDASKKLTRLTEKTDGNTLACKALDQYGNKLKLDAYVQGTDYQLVVAGGTVVVGADKLTLNGTDLAAGTFTIRAIVMASGSVSEMYTETVYAKPKVASFDIAVPETIYADEKAAFTIEATDQYGKAIKVADPSGWAITPLSTTVKVIDGSREDAENKITVKFNTKGTADLYFQTGALTVVKPISVQAKKVVSSIASIPLSTEALLLTKTIAINKDKVIVNDQYGNKLTDGKKLTDAGWKWELRRLADTLPYGLATDTDKATIFVIDNPNLKIAAQKAGTEQLRLTLYTGGDYGQTELDTYKEYVYDFNLSAVAASAVVAFDFDVADQMYCGEENRLADHDIAIKIIGKTANGTTVTLTDTPALPDIVGQYTVTGTVVQILAATSKLSTLNPIDKDSSAVLKAWDKKGVVVAEKTIILSAAKITRTTLEMKYDKDTKTVGLKAKDQYGVAMAAPAGTFYSSDEKILTVDEAGVITPVKTGTAIVRFVSDDGVWSREVEVSVVKAD
ncbi:MAG: hypothetical protein ACOX2V_00200 [Clostridia bacterium]